MEKIRKKGKNMKTYLSTGWNIVIVNVLNIVIAVLTELQKLPLDSDQVVWIAVALNVITILLRFFSNVPGKFSGK